MVDAGASPVAASHDREPSTSAPRTPRRFGLLVGVAVLAALLGGTVVVAVGIGQAVVGPAETARYLWAALSGGRISAAEVPTYQIIWQVRAPRVLLAAVVGAGLGVVGVAVQSMVRNALADPFVLGISSGASVGAVAVLVLGFLAGLGVHGLSLGAFIGALVAAVLVYAAASTGVGTTPLRLVLTGVALSFGFQAVMSVLIYFAPDSEAAGTVLYWTMGSFGAATWASLPAVTVIVVAGAALLHRHARSLDAMALGDETAVSLGIDTAAARKGLFVLTSLMTGAMVAVSGAIGFVGLVMPHLVRLVVGSRHASVLSVIPFVGAIFMVAVDCVARTLVAPRELPLGAITALVGVPVFVVLMRRKGYLFGGR